MTNTERIRNVEVVREIPVEMIREVPVTTYKETIREVPQKETIQVIWIKGTPQEVQHKEVRAGLGIDLDLFLSDRNVGGAANDSGIHQDCECCQGGMTPLMMENMPYKNVETSKLTVA